MSYFPTPAEVICASLLDAYGHLPRQVITTKAEEIEASWSNESYIPSPAEVHCASSLAAHGHLPRQVITNKAAKIASRQSMSSCSLSKLQCAAALATLGHITQVSLRLSSLRLYNLDISLVPAEDLVSLVKCQRSGPVSINGVTGDLSPVLSSVQCCVLLITNTSLSTSDTQQLVAAMDTRVKEVTLESGNTLDIETLAQYNGMGECEKVIFRGESSMRYKNQAKVWAGNMGWRIEEANTGDIFIKRK